MKAVKFNFGDDFEAQTVDQAELDALAAAERLRKSEESAFEKGVTSGKAEASQEIATELVAVLESVADKANTLFAQRSELEDRVERDATQLAVAMARKLAASALEMHPHAEIETLITECMETCREQPKIVVRLSQSQCDALAAKVEELKQRNAFAGDVILLGDEEINDGDCLVEWPDGGAERRTGHISQAIEKLIQAFVMKPPAAGQMEQVAEAEVETTDDVPTGETEPGDTEQDDSQDQDTPTMEQPGAP